MDMLQLETFACLIRQGNFSRTAKQLGVSQPTVTIRIKALEDELGVPLIIRAGHKVKLTTSGQVFYDQIERSLRVLNEGVDVVSGNATQRMPRLSVAVTPNLGTYFLPPILGRIYRAHKDWELSLMIGQSWNVVEMVLDEVCQVGLINGFVKHPDIVKTPLFKDQFHLVAYPRHPLVGKDRVSLYDLTDEPIFTYKLESNMSYMIKSLFRDIKIKNDINMELSDSYTMKKMILEGNGIGFMPWSAAESAVKMGLLYILPVELPVPLCREVNMITLRKNADIDQVTTFSKEMMENLQSS